MDAGELAHCAVRIEQFQADRKYGDILTLLGDLDKSHIRAEQLETTDIAKALYRLLKSCSDASVKTAAKALLSKWKRQYGRDRGTLDASVCPPQEAVDGGHVEKDAQSTSLVRSKCVQLLLAALCPDPPDRDEGSELARDVERHVHQLHASSQVRYKACVRSKVANLRNPKNGHLRQGLLSGSLSPEAFARMSAEEMAGAELRQLRERYAASGVSERRLPPGIEGTPTNKIRCRRCEGSDCRVTQVSRGALFLPAWVRQSGPDDDAMTFVTCSSCGQQWYHSGWVCL